jgi:hypothetical protein
MAKKQTYADRAKAIMNKYKPRLGEKFDKGDTLALEAMNQELTALQQEQEQARLAEQEAEAAFQDKAVQTFQNGGKLTKKQKSTLSVLLANRNTPFVQNMLSGVDQRMEVGTNELGQPAVFPRRFPGSEQPKMKNQSMLRARGEEPSNYIPFGDMKSARKFKRNVPKVLNKLEDQPTFGKGSYIYANGGGLFTPKGGQNFSELPNRFGETATAMALSRETPFISSLTEGQRVPLARGVFNTQDVVYPANLSLEEAAMNRNFVPFGTEKSARRFVRQAPRVADRVGTKRFSGSERPNFYGGAPVAGPSNVNLQMAGPIGYATGGLLPILVYGGDLPLKGKTTQGGLAAKAKQLTPKDYNEDALRLGIDVEYEHTNNKALAMKIAMDHLQEDPNYYTQLPDPDKAAQQGAAMEALGMKRMGGNLPVYKCGGRMREDGGMLPMYQDGGEIWNFNTGQGAFNTPQLTPSLNYFDPATGSYSRIPAGQQQPGGGVSFGDRNLMAANRDFLGLAAANTSPVNLDYTAPTSLGGYQAQMGGITPATTLAPTPVATGDQEIDPYQFRAPWLPAVATGLGSVLGNRQLDLPNFENVQDIRAQEVMPRLVDYSRGREQTMRERDLAQAMVRRAAKARGSQQGVTQSTIAGATATQRGAGEAFNRSLEGESNENARIRNQAAQFNAMQRARAGETNLRSALMRGQYDRENALINAQRRTNQIAGITGALTGYGRDLLQANRDTGFLRLEEDPDYPIQQRNDALWKRIFGVDADPYKTYTGPMRSMKQITG